MTRAQFEALVARALRRLPRRFRDRIANVAVVVEDWADAATLAEMGIEPPDTLYGLYRGIDLTRRDSGYGFTSEAASDFADRGCTVIVTGDCGTSDLVALELAAASGLSGHEIGDACLIA